MIGTHWYHGHLSKYIAAFGSIFNDITLVKYNKAHTQEIKRTKVPIVYGPREKYLVRNADDPDLQKKVQATYPMMSFVETGYSYASARKGNSLHKLPKAVGVGGNADTVYDGVPYDMGFELSIIARNKDDAFQIVEQILPIFNPNFTFTQVLVPEIGIVKDIPLLLNRVSEAIEYSDGFDETVQIEFTLSFTMQVWLYGPVTNTKIIRRVFANTFLDPSLYKGALVRVNLANGNNGIYETEDIVYQGDTLTRASAAGIVHSYSSNNAYLLIGAVQGDFAVNTDIKAASTNAVWRLASFDVSPLKIQSIVIEPDPITANVGDPFGYSETFTEFPDTLS